MLAVAHYGRPLWFPKYVALTGGSSVSATVDRLGPSAVERISPYFESAGVPIPPSRIALIALKREKTLELWAFGDTWVLIRTYPILAASGRSGPKLREGDRQVPEGVYRIEGLNPNSSYHLSMKLDYPNAFDRAMARDDGRTQLGGDIFIHGKAVSIGCIAVGDPAIEEIFTLVAKIGKSAVTVIIAPHDLRLSQPPEDAWLPSWSEQLYSRIQDALREFSTVSG
jgi:hypothetical protein